MRRNRTAHTLPWAFSRLLVEGRLPGTFGLAFRDGELVQTRNTVKCLHTVAHDYDAPKVCAGQVVIVYEADPVCNYALVRVDGRAFPCHAQRLPGHRWRLSHDGQGGEALVFFADDPRFEWIGPVECRSTRRTGPDEGWPYQNELPPLCQMYAN
ncbi:MAG TPA: hypothetical protein VD948_05775 [Rhodothermales bacterium]|nr:hypothetical protein [Rhodothermales bacterium]